RLPELDDTLPNDGVGERSLLLHVSNLRRPKWDRTAEQKTFARASRFSIELGLQVIVQVASDDYNATLDANVVEIKITSHLNSRRLSGSLAQAATCLRNFLKETT